MPLLVLRDPPGSGSFAEYNSIQTVISLDIVNEELFAGFYSEDEAFVHIGHESTLCTSAGTANGPPGALITVATGTCHGSSHSHGKIGAELEYDKMKGGLQKEDINSKETVMEWSMTTSPDASLPGKLSDMFMTPVLNVVFSLIREVTWNEDTCRAFGIDKYKFTLREGMVAMREWKRGWS